MTVNKNLADLWFRGNINNNFLRRLNPNAPRILKKGNHYLRKTVQFMQQE